MAKLADQRHTHWSHSSHYVYFIFNIFRMSRAIFESWDCSAKCLRVMGFERLHKHFWSFNGQAKLYQKETSEVYCWACGIHCNKMCSYPCSAGQLEFAWKHVELEGVTWLFQWALRQSWRWLQKYHQQENLWRKPRDQLKKAFSIGYGRTCCVLFAHWTGSGLGSGLRFLECTSRAGHVLSQALKTKNSALRYRPSSKSSCFLTLHFVR